MASPGRVKTLEGREVGDCRGLVLPPTSVPLTLVPNLIRYLLIFN